LSQSLFHAAPPAGKGPFHAEVTGRTAAKTAAVVTFINSELLDKAVSNH
jgi:hypothetical protein